MKIFISYKQSISDDIVRRTRSALAGKGHDVFIDHASLVPAETLGERIDHDISCCDLFICFWSRSYSASRWCIYELFWALDKVANRTCRLLTICLDDYPVSFLASDLVYLPFKKVSFNSANPEYVPNQCMAAIYGNESAFVRKATVRCALVGKAINCENMSPTDISSVTLLFIIDKTQETPKIGIPGLVVGDGGTFSVDAREEKITVDSKPAVALVVTVSGVFPAFRVKALNFVTDLVRASKSIYYREPVSGTFEPLLIAPNPQKS